MTDTWVGPRFTTIARQILSRGQNLALYTLRIVYSYSGVGAPVVMVVATYWLVRHIMNRIRMAKVKKCHQQLQMLLRLYDVVLETVQSARSRRVRSYAELIAAPSRVDYKDSLKPASRQLMEGVALPRPLPLYRRGFHGMLRFGTDMAFSTFGFGWRMSRCSIISCYGMECNVMECNGM
jgi:hypothetical protein